MTKYRIVKEEKRGYYTFYYVQCRKFLLWWGCDTDGLPWFYDTELKSRVYSSMEDAKNAIARFKYSGTKVKKEVIWEDE